MMDEIGNQLIGLVEIGANKLLGMDSDMLQICEELQGAIIAIELIDLDKTIYFHPGTWGMRLSLQAPGKAVDACIRGRLFSLINMSQQQDKISTSIQERIEISGNTAVAQKFQKILTGLDIDWEEQLSKVTGDIVAFRIGQSLRKSHNWIKDSLTAFALSSREYLQEEAHHMPTLPEFEYFKQAVTGIRNDVDRIEALINHKFKPKE